MKTTRKVFLSLILSLFLIVSVFNLLVQNSQSYDVSNKPAADAIPADMDLAMTEADQLVAGSAPDNFIAKFRAGVESVSLNSLSAFPSFNRHLMCKDYTRPHYDPVEPTTTFRPSDKQAVCLTTVWINSTIEFRWYYRDNSSKAWIYTDCNHTETVCELADEGGCHYAGYLYIAGYWPGVYYPRAYKVDVYLDGVFSFSEFFEVTNGGLNSPRVCEDVDANDKPVNMKSRFTAGVDAKVCYYLKFDRMAYFNEETNRSHIFTTVWVQPDGTSYVTRSWPFEDYKDNDTSLNYWKYGLVRDDFISINSTILLGNWKVEVYLDEYLLNDTWTPYGPISTTPFIIADESIPAVPDWAFMVYLDADNSLANVQFDSEVLDLSVEVFLKMANVQSSPNVSVVVQMDRAPSSDVRYGNWTGAKRFNITKGMTPTAENATQDLGEDVNMGDPNTLKDFINWTVNNYPAEHYFLVLWDHGSGVMGLCEDDTSGNDSLSLPELREAMNGIPVVIDDMLIDACSMSMTEVAYQIRESVNVLIGPEGLGYAPAPYDDYVNSLIGNSTMSPSTMASEIVADYIRWCYAASGQIENATMAAVDLTKMTGLAAAVDDFAMTLKEREILYHAQITLARNMTTEYVGPTAHRVENTTIFQTGYYIDLYNFTWLINGTVPDQKLRNASGQVMTAIDNAVIIAIDINDPGTNGLAVYFPNEKQKYNFDSFASIYENTTFAKDTSWDEFVKHHLSGFFLEIITNYPRMPVTVDEDAYNTTDMGEIRLFLQPGPHTANVTAVFLPTSEPEAVQAVFVQWQDGNASSTRTFTIGDKDVNVEAQYQLQYRLTIETDTGETDPTVGKHWCNASSPLNITATPPNRIEGENYTVTWVLKGAITSNSSSNPVLVTMNGPINATAVWKHEYSLSVTSLHGASTTEYLEAGQLIIENVTSPQSESTGTRYVCVGWAGTGSAPASGTSTMVAFVLTQPSSIQWNWKVQYQLTLHTYPKGLNPQPNVSPADSWFDNGTTITCTAQQIGGYNFEQWSTRDSSWDVGVNPINITMDGPYDATANYVRASAWWEFMGRPDVMQAMLALLGTFLTVGLLGGAWFRSRRRRDIVKRFLTEIDDVYSRFKADPKKCEEELYTLRNTILEGFTDGKITEENYDILDKRIDKHVSELAEKTKGQT